MRKIFFCFLVISVVILCTVSALAEKANSDISDWHPFNSEQKSSQVSIKMQKSNTNNDSNESVHTVAIILVSAAVILFIVVKTIRAKASKEKHKNYCSRVTSDLCDKTIKKDDLSSNEVLKTCILIMDCIAEKGYIKRREVLEDNNRLPSYIKEINSKLLFKLPNGCTSFDIYISILTETGAVYNEKDSDVWKSCFTPKEWKAAKEYIKKAEVRAREDAIRIKTSRLIKVLSKVENMKNEERIIKAIRKSTDILVSLSQLGIEGYSCPMNENEVQIYKTPEVVDCAIKAVPSEYFVKLHNLVKRCIELGNDDVEVFNTAWNVFISKNANKTELKGRLLNDIKEAYTKIQYIYESLISYGLIDEDNEYNNEAFRILVYNVWYEWINEIANHETYYCDNMLSCVEKMNNEGYSEFQITYMVAAHDYITEQNDYFVGYLLKNEGKVKLCLEEITKKEYIDNLLDESSPRNNLKVTIYDTDVISPYDFEELIAKLFVKMGYKAHTTKKSGDQGVDVIAQKGIRTIAIQTKCYPGTVVGNDAIQEVVAGMKYYNANDAYVVTNSTYTKSAIELASANNVTLWDRKILSTMLERYPIQR